MPQSPITNHPHCPHRAPAIILQHSASPHRTTTLPRTVHIITRLIIGGAQENTLWTAIDQLRDYGDEVTLITGPAIGPEGSLLDEAKRHGVPLRLVSPMRRSLHPWRDWRSYRMLIALLRSLNPEIVHTHSSKAGILGRAAAYKLGIPAVHTIHGAAFHYGQSRLAYRTYVRAEKWAAKRTARFITVCDAMIDQYVAAGVAPREKFTTIYSGMDVEPFLTPPRDPQQVRAELGLSPEHVVVGKIGRLFHLKGHEYVVQAARAVIEACPLVRFLFVGDGVLRDSLKREIDKLGISDHFIFTGLVPPTQVPELIHAMDVVVHTSEWEGLARVLPQGLIAGKPVVSYDIDGAKEVVLPGETGYLLPPRSIAEVSQALIELVQDPELRNRMGTAGRERFTDPFRHQTMTRRIREVYAEVLAEQ